MWRAVALGYVKHADACFVNDGLRHGFMAGVQVENLRGHRWFRNYPTALDNRGAVVDATVGRIASSKTVDLGVWSGALAHSIRAMFAATAIFPMGAVPKNALYAPGEYRPTSDHTRTGLNAVTDLSFLRHALNTYDEVAWFLRHDYFMRVSDVDSAFPMLPLHPDLWPFFLFRFFIDPSDTQHLMCHLFGDFGAAGMPGTFKKFLVDVVLGMARSVQVLTLPMLVWVDDCALVGAVREAVDEEMVRFHEWACSICGVFFKAVKDKLAAQRQLYIGFWWDSRSFTRELEERKLLQYVEMLSEFASRSTLSLHELQVVAGRMQRAIMTFPPGAACLLVSIFQLMTGLRLPWHKRRTTRRARADFRLVADFLTLNMGRGYYSYDGFARAPEVRSDASKSKAWVAGGFVSACGAYCWWRYGTSAKRKLIDFLEGDTVVETVRRMCPRWRQCVVPFGVDNSAFQRSAAKGRSAVNRLNDLVRELFSLMVQHHFILDFFWLSSEDNLLADDLSRNKEEAFLQHARSSGFWPSHVTPERLQGTGDKRTLPESRGAVTHPAKSADLQGTGDKRNLPESRGAVTHPANSADAVPRGGRRSTPACVRGSVAVLALLAGALPVASPMPVSRVMSSAPGSRASIFAGLPGRLVPMVENVLDNRLASSSWRTVEAGMAIWRTVADDEGWSTIIATDDPQRGGKLATLVCHMIEHTDLVWGSIESYVWGVRTWMKSQHELDPVLGIVNWAEFMDATKVLTWVPSEPRRRFPVEVVKKIIEDADVTSFADVQMVFLILLLLFTFSRSETPCPKSRTGRDSYSAEEHLNVQDIDVTHIEDAPTMRVRFRKVKQDQRVERPEARADGDWSILGDLPNTIFSMIKWYTLLAALHGAPRQKDAPFFVDPRNHSQALLYGQALEDVKRRQRKVGVPEDKIAGLHGLRVEGYNGTRDVLGADVAQAHGLWASAVHNRYARFAMATVTRIPAAIVGVFSPAESAEERAAGPPAHRLTRTDVGSGAAAATGPTPALPPPPSKAPPPGWSVRQQDEFRDGSGRLLSRPRKVFVSPGGSTTAASVKDAWRLYRAVAAEEGAPSPVASTVASPSGSVEASVRGDSPLPVDIRGQVRMSDVRRSARISGPALPYTSLAY